MASRTHLILCAATRAADRRNLMQLLAGGSSDSAPFAKFAQPRYSEEQLYALALYIYSLKPPSNPNKFDSVAARVARLLSSDRLRGDCDLGRELPSDVENTKARKWDYPILLDLATF